MNKTKKSKSNKILHYFYSTLQLIAVITFKTGISII